MPVTISELQVTMSLEFHLPLSQLTIHQIAPIPQLTDSGLTRETILHLLKFSDDVVALWIGPQAVMSPLPPLRALCVAVEARNRQMRHVLDLPERMIKARPLIRQKNEKQLLETFGRESNSRRPFVRLLMELSGATQAKAWLNSFIARSLKAAYSRDQVDATAFVGWRDWDQLSSWERGVTLLAAARFIERVKLKRGTSPESKAPSSSNSLAHSPSLTARQASRSGVSQDELRARWA